MPESIEFVKLRHAQTEVDQLYKRNEAGVFVPQKGKNIIKGSSDNSILYRLSDEGILYAYETALKLLEHYQQGKRVRLFHSPLTRTTESEEILRGVLKDVTHTPIDEFKERGFGGIEGLTVEDFEAAVLETKMFPTYSIALTHADDFSVFEKYLGLEVQGGEPFKDTFKRVYSGIQKVVKECFTSNYVPLYDYVILLGHQIEGVFSLACLLLLRKTTSEVEKIIDSIETQDDKEREVPYLHLKPSHFNRIRYISYEGRLWFEGQEHNDWHHLALLEDKLRRQEKEGSRLQEDDLERVAKVRKLLTRWYAQRELPVNPSLETQPFYMCSLDNQQIIEILSPSQLSNFLKDPQKMPNSFLQYYMGKLENINQIPDWIRNVFGYEDLAENITNLNKSLIRGRAPIHSIRSGIQKVIEDYVSLPKKD